VASRKPWEFYPALLEARLEVIAEALLDVYYDVQSELVSPLDDNYTRGTTTFGRQKNKLIQLCRSAVYSWLDLRNTSNDLTCAIDGIPFRFFRDDHENPSKRGFWRRNDQDDMFPVADDQPVIFRFVVEHSRNQEDEATVYFLGFTQEGQLACEWRYSETIRTLRSVTGTRPTAEETPPPVVEPRDEEQEEKQDRKREDGKG